MLKPQLFHDPDGALILHVPGTDADAVLTVARAFIADEEGLALADEPITVGHIHQIPCTGDGHPLADGYCDGLYEYAFHYLYGPAGDGTVPGALIPVHYTDDTDGEDDDEYDEDDE